MTSAKAEREAAEELLIAAKQKLSQATTVNHSLKKELKAVQMHATELAVDLKKRRRKLISAELLIKDTLRNAEETAN